MPKLGGMQGSEIEAARKALGMNRTQLGAAVGVSERSIYRWERDEVKIPKPAMVVLAQILGNKPATKRPKTRVTR